MPSVPRLSAIKSYININMSFFASPFVDHVPPFPCNVLFDWRLKKI